MNITLNPQVDKYLIDGCMRCKYGATPKCKVNQWREELELLRQIVLETGLKEEIKWGAPVYTHQGKNVILVNALKESANIGFFKGALLSDKHQILQQQGNVQAARIIRFKQVNEIEKVQTILTTYIKEAIALEESGQKVELNKNPEPLPEELIESFKDDKAFEKAFNALTPGRQRAYIIHFSQPKQSQTRMSRIEKYKAQIFNGIGLHDEYKNRLK
ncbi:hypothetical protein FYC62_01965 [Pedobacter aquae]|uniref:YdhG-like domain-containing protein n=1 Tax=Pedobacter aquae TaxID=2605747 RepID=A0A5C0VEQ2_9SPHI|nr:DUF1801 domain-containing protein [Pedobacter aquae]QEK50569.1 hypothetical protein FYC62_01965 [Pedobacter aquae]